MIFDGHGDIWTMLRAGGWSIRNAMYSAAVT